MKITLMMVGKTDDDYIVQGFSKFEKRLKHYISFESVIIPDVKRSKKTNTDDLKNKEAEMIMGKISSSDFLVLLDERGKEYRSVDFASFIENKMIASTKHIVFLVGGAYGFSKALYDRANGKVSLSKLTFSHQLIRLLFIEQLYRAFTIIKGEPYHHE